MAFLFTIHGRMRTIQEGYLHCPRCLVRHPGRMVCSSRRVWMFGLIPTFSLAEGPTRLVCGRCGESFSNDEDFPFDFGEHAEPQRWTCRQCGEENTNDRFRCKRCAKHI